MWGSLTWGIIIPSLDAQGGGASLDGIAHLYTKRSALKAARYRLIKFGYHSSFQFLGLGLPVIGSPLFDDITEYHGSFSVVFFDIIPLGINDFIRQSGSKNDMGEIMRMVIFLSTVFIFNSLTLAQTTWTVPDDYPTIQTALSHVSVTDGDTVEVRPGTYCENIAFQGKGITLVSTHGQEVTVIDGMMNGSVVVLIGGKGKEAVLEGFTITNGSGTLRDLQQMGAGIFCYNTTCLMQNNIITQNINTPAAGILKTYGNGIYCGNSDVVIWSNEISNNHNTQYEYLCFGGGIYSTMGFIQIINNLITGNTCSLDNGETRGGGICFMDGSVEIIHNTITHNLCDSIFCSGGGIYGEEVQTIAHLSENFITDNSAIGAGATGGGVFIYGSELVNNLIARNKVSGGLISGGGVYCISYNNPVQIMNNTIYGNQLDNTSGKGAGLYSDQSTYPVTVTNTILWGNLGAPDINDKGTFIHCTIGNGSLGSNNINDNPLLMDPDNDDFHLSSYSPCINRGINEGIPDVDQDLNDRLIMGTVDMGAYEYSGKHPLEANVFEMSQSLGGSVQLTLDASPDNGSRIYLMFGSSSDTIPGIPLPEGTLKLPLVWDMFTDQVLRLLNTPVFMDFLGTLNSAGLAAVTLNANSSPLPVSFIGRKLCFAYALDVPWDYVSNPITVEVVP